MPVDAQQQSSSHNAEPAAGVAPPASVRRQASKLTDAQGNIDSTGRMDGDTFAEALQAVDDLATVVTDADVHIETQR